MKRRSFGFLAATLVILPLVGHSADAEDWMQFRGPRGDGSSADTKVPVEFGDKKNLKWKLALPGRGFSSPIIVGDKVFVTAYSGDGNQTQRHLICVDRKGGKIVWQKAIDGVSDSSNGRNSFAYHGQASHTPVSDGKHVYVMFGSSGVFAFDLTGKQVWTQKVGNEGRARFGTSSSPILAGDLLIVTAGSESESIRAFNKTTGKEVWKTEAGSLSATYSTPTLGKSADGREELIIPVSEEVWSLNPKTGKLNWYAGTRVDRAACPKVIVDSGIAYVVGGRSGGRTAVKLGGKDDVTDSHVVWSTNGGTYVPSPVLYKGHLYWVNDQGIASCINAKTGEQVSRKRIGGRFYASLTLINDKLYAISRFSGVYVLKADKSLEQLSVNKFKDDSDFSGSPAVSGGELYIRSDANLYCIAATGDSK